MGGIALGKGVTASGLLDDADVLVRELVKGLPLYGVVVVLSAVVLVRGVLLFLHTSLKRPVGRVHVYQPHHRQRFTCPYRHGSWSCSGGPTGQSTHLLDWAHLLHGDGNASFWLP